jgi:hypothetical protein
MPTYIARRLGKGHAIYFACVALGVLVMLGLVGFVPLSAFPKKLFHLLFLVHHWCKKM